MKKIFYRKNTKTTVISNRPVDIKDSQDLKEIELTEEQYKQAFDSRYAFDIDEAGNPIINKKPPTTEEQTRKNLKKKLTDGTATDEDIKQAINLIL